MVFRCPNIQAHYNEAVLCLNFGTPEINEFSIWNKWKFIILGVPILKHSRVYKPPINLYRRGTASNRLALIL